MLRYRILKDEDGSDVFEVDSDGFELLHNPILNKGDAFPSAERRLFRIDGFLPPAVATLEKQIARSYENYRMKPSDIEKYIFLRSLQDRNETLFYALLLEHLEEMIPVVYTPTVGQACQNYSHIFRFARGIFLSPGNIGSADEIFRSLPYKNIEMIVATDSEGILGIGDQGVGGMGIPIGKLSLYVAGAGINPANCLPVTLDAGTNNEDLLRDPLYMGIKQRRLQGEPYLLFIDKFVEAVRRNFPRAVLQWEDFSKQNAATLLDKYRESLPSFNDDIQGTGAVALAGIRGALRIKGEKLSDQVFVVYGAGAGGIGVIRQITSALVLEGLPEKEALGKIFIIDSKGVVFEGRGGIEDYKRPFCKPPGFSEGWDLRNPDRITLLETVKNAKPTVLIGLSGRAGDFTREIILAMLEHCEQPILFPLSNPTSRAEAVPSDLFLWTKGRAIVATGSPFPDVNYEGRIFKAGQGNNAFIFPGLGLGALIVKAKTITDEMFDAASKKLAELVSQFRLDLRCVYPPIEDLRRVSREIAVAVALAAMDRGVAANPIAPELLEQQVSSKMWVPRYCRFTRGTRTTISG
ncbi:MAG: NAD-dependent malic enzyme [Pseudomonadota bacterium]